MQENNDSQREPERAREQMYYIGWVNESNEFQGRGQPISKTDADTWVKAMNEKYPNITHRAFPAKAKDDS